MSQAKPKLDIPQPFADFAIQTKDKRLARLNPNRQQVGVLAAIAAQQCAGVPVRLLILKGRQFGMSTIVEAVMYREVEANANGQAFVCAHNDESSTNIFRMAKRYEEHWPVDKRRPTDNSSRREIIWSAPHSSQFRVQTAGNVTLGRSMTIQYLHCSEVAHWDNAKLSLAAVLQAVPDASETVDTMVFMETTANGIGGEFYDRWQAAVKQRRERPDDLSGYLPLFFSWLDFEKYRLSLPADYELGELDEDELELVGLSADEEQLFWRRRILADKLGGDVELFKQEYPHTPESAFISSGRPVVAASILREHRRTVEEPRRGRLVRDNLVDGGIRVEYDLDKEHSPIWDIWRTPEEFHDYVGFEDIAEGQLSNPTDAKSDGDYTAALIMDRVTLAFVAQMHDRPDPDVAGDELLKAVQYYDRAWGTPEANAAGMAALMAFKRAQYSRCYRRRMEDDRLELKEVGRLGWKTTRGNRENMIDDYLAACRPDPINGFDGCIINFSERLVAEEETFIRNKDGKREHRVGCFDDVLFAAIGCWQLHLRCPRTRIISFPRHTVGQIRGLAYADGTDTELAALEAGVTESRTG